MSRFEIILGKDKVMFLSQLTSQLNLFCILSKCNFISVRQLSSSRELSILFYGSDDFSLATIRLLRQKFTQTDENSNVRIRNLEVVTNSECNVISTYCKNVNLKCHQFNTFTVESNRFHLGVVSSFGRLIPSRSIDSCQYGLFEI